MLYDKERWEHKIEVVKPMQPWQEILLKAADLIEKEGWARNSFKLRGRYCIVGAINHVDTGDAFNDRCSYSAFDARMRLHVALKVQSIADWNDHKAKSKVEVVRVMRKVAMGEW